ncbi:hypothetical protein F2P81_022583 [Scophthalmus maximus]|uniref:Uncharacterized protein n=1 Tax=Scophthalmus maximus TaxID=52904 RepID=A0A6A4S2Z4_SCOMX|nr:hypothetical protein F2P81_022583 [Scophthalmus maximus]
MLTCICYSVRGGETLVSTFSVGAAAHVISRDVSPENLQLMKLQAEMAPRDYSSNSDSGGAGLRGGQDQKGGVEESSEDTWDLRGGLIPNGLAAPILRGDDGK